jgi:hypothetical protein
MTKHFMDCGGTDLEVEYQQGMSGRSKLDNDGRDFLPTPGCTACLAHEACSILKKARLSLAELSTAASTSCTPGSSSC